MPHPLLFILAAIDIISGGLLFFHPSFLTKVILYFAVICLVKGGWSVFTSIISKFYFDFLGFVDLFAGIFLLLLYYNFSLPFLSIVGLVIFLKGIWSMFFSITS